MVLPPARLMMDRTTMAKARPTSGASACTKRVRSAAGSRLRSTYALVPPPSAHISFILGMLHDPRRLAQELIRPNAHATSPHRLSTPQRYHADQDYLLIMAAKLPEGRAGTYIGCNDKQRDTTH